MKSPQLILNGSVVWIDEGNTWMRFGKAMLGHATPIVAGFIGNIFCNFIMKNSIIRMSILNRLQNPRNFFVRFSFPFSFPTIFFHGQVLPHGYI